MKAAAERSVAHVEHQRLPSDNALCNDIHLPAFMSGGGGSFDQEAFPKLPLSNLAYPMHDAKSAAALEHAMPAREPLRLYSKAVLFSMILSLALVMEGFDTSLIGAFFGLPEFQKRFGKRLDDGTYQITAAWMSGLQNGATIGEIIGLFASGLVYERYGYKKTMLGALVMVICCIFALFFAHNLPSLLVGEILCGIPWGVF